MPVEVPLLLLLWPWLEGGVFDSVARVDTIVRLVAVGAGRDLDGFALLDIVAGS